MKDHKFIFVCGLNRSGTTILQRIISSAEECSGFSNTGVLEDEGQHLQSVYLQAKYYGGAGNFAFDPKANLKEDSSLITTQNQEKLFKEWSRHWDLSKTYLVEKSPVNIISTRFLQSMFANSYFVIITRHPIAVSYATQKWSKTSLNNLVDHWLAAHDIYLNDSNYLRNKLLISYESLVSKPKETLELVSKFVGVDIPYHDQLKNYNTPYFDKWINTKWYRPYRRHIKKNLSSTHERFIEKFGYSFYDLTQFP